MGLDLKSKLKDKKTIEGIKLIVSKYQIILIFIVMVVIASLLSPAFMTTSNITNILRQVSVVGIVSVGVTAVMIGGGIDLSMGSIIAFSSVVAASLAQAGSNYAIGIVAGILAGTACGLFNGAIIAIFNIAPFIVTLGMMTIAKGMALLYSGGLPIGNLDPSYEFIGQGRIIGIPIPVIIFFIVVLIMHYIMSKAAFGRHLYAIGGNINAARAAGISIKRNKVLVYALNGLLAGLAGVILTARVSTGAPLAGTGYELDAITAVVSGGTSLGGGVGFIGGTLVGALVIGVLNNSLTLLGVNPFWQLVIKGLIIIFAVILDQLRKKRY